MACSDSSDHVNDQREIRDSDEDSPIDSHSPDVGFSPSHPHRGSPKASVTIASSSLATGIEPATATNRSEKPSSLSPRALEFQRKIIQLRSTIESTEVQLSEVLGKLSALPPFQQQDTTASPSKNPSAAFNTTITLPLDQQRTLTQAQKTLDRHIKQLGRYNQLKDIARGMLGMIAEKEGKMLREVMDARDVEDDD